MVIRFDPQSPTERHRAAKWSLIVACVVFLVKLTGYLATHSTAILSDTLESLVNIAAAMLLIFGMRVSDKPPDDEHPFGHGKADFLVSSFEGGAIVIAGILIIFEAISNWFAGRSPHDLGLGLGVVALAAVINGGLGCYLLRVGRRTSSVPLEADARHVLSDAWTSIGVFVGLLLAYITGQLWIDSVVAIIFALLILRMGWKLLHQAIQGMMDTADPAVVAQIESILQNPPDTRICSHHKLRHRLSGGFHNVDFHLQFPREMPVEEAHAIGTEVEKQIAARLGHASVMAHIEPCESATCKKCHPN